MQKLKDWILRGLVTAFFGHLVFPIAGAFLVATLTGLFSGLEAPWNYTLAVSLGVFTLGVLEAIMRRLEPGLPLPWGGQAPAAKVAGNAALSMTAIRGPQSSGLSLIDWELAGERNHTITVPRRARALRFVEPVTRTVRVEQLPKRIRWRFRTILLVKNFGSDSVLVDEYARGFRVRAEVYHVDD